MAEKRSLTPLILGLIMVGLGGLFLAVNVWDFEVDWVDGLLFLFPLLLLAGGLSKLIRHFSWSPARLAERPGRAGLLSGIFWTCLGAVWLLDSFQLLEGFSFFSLYWPLILILFGLGKMIDYYRLHGSLRFRAAELFGVVFVILIGFACGLAADAHWPLLQLPVSWGRHRDFGEIMREKFSWTEEKSIPAGDLQRVEVVNLYGDVSVEGGAGDSLGITLEKVVFESSRAKAEKIADQITLTTSTRSNTLQVGTNRKDLSSRQGSFKSHIRLLVPKRFSVKVSNKHGNVRLRQLEARCEVDNSDGEVIVERITGEVQIKNSYRKSEARDITGDLKIEGRRGPVEIEDVSGNVQVSTDYDQIVARRIGGKVVASNRFGKVLLETVAGTVDVTSPGSEVTVSDVQRTVTIRNSHKTVTAQRLREGLELESRYGRVRLSQIAGPVTIQASHTDISAQELQSGATVTARGSRVALSEIDGPFSVVTSLQRVTIRQFSGTGQVQNEYGEIVLEADAPLEGPLTVANKNGRITLSLPAQSTFTLSAQAPGGKIVSDFEPKAEARKNVSVMETSVGRGGPTVRLQTTYAQIRIKKR
ncbi:MAG: DUF4097 family beta strand repeat-containing protein [Acidobacteriota bacterium]